MVPFLRVYEPTCSVFFDVLHTEWNAHAYGNHTTADFQATAEAVSGRDLD